MKATQAVTGTSMADVKRDGRPSAGPGHCRGDEAGRRQCARPSATRPTNPIQIFAMTQPVDLVARGGPLLRRGAGSVVNNKFEDARENLLKAVELDPKFGVGYLLLAGVARNLGQLQDAQKYVNQAMSHLDDMTRARTLHDARACFSG